MPTRLSLRQALLLEAQQWDETTKSGDPRALAEFAAWIRRSPEHLQAYLQHLSIQTELSGVDPNKEVDLPALLAEVSNNVIPFNAAASVAPAMRKTFDYRHRYGLAALPLLMVLAVGIWLWKAPGNERQSADYVTAVGEQRRMTLPDGSIAELNTRTHVRVVYTRSEREVELVSGEAFFDVQHHQNWPFRVRVGESMVEDVGTQFAIYLKQDRSAVVSVLAGRVQLRSPGPRSTHSDVANTERTRTEGTAVQLEGGQAVRMDTDGTVLTLSNVDLSEIASWRQHRLWFENSTLQEIATEFNRYNTRQFTVIETPAVAAKHYTATWDPYDPDSFVTYLQSDPALSVESTERVIVIRGRDAPQN
jgi:transmembrane sensor